MRSSVILGCCARLRTCRAASARGLRSIVRGRRSCSNASFAMRAIFPRTRVMSPARAISSGSPHSAMRFPIIDKATLLRRSDRLLPGRPDTEISIDGSGNQWHHGHTARRLSKFRLDSLGRSFSPAALAVGGLEPRAASSRTSRRDRDPGRAARSAFLVQGHRRWSAGAVHSPPRSANRRAVRRRVAPLRRHAAACLSIRRL